MGNTLPNSVRYVKNGEGRRWWKAAKADGQVHLGWSIIPDDLLRAADLTAIEPIIRQHLTDKGSATRDFNALRSLLDHPSQHLWVTIEDQCMWWCTVRDGIEINPEGETNDRGHFWLTCVRPWSNRSLGGRRHLVTAELPGIITSVAGYRATVCKPNGSKEILRIIRNEEDEDARAAGLARQAYQNAVAKLIARLGPKDFEVLVDLILSRTGWARLAIVGGTRADIDIEVENASADEIAFVQVKSSASQTTLDHYVSIFNDQRDRYKRMIFVVHSATGKLTPPDGEPVQVWTGERVAQLVVKHGLGDWVATRL